MSAPKKIYRQARTLTGIVPVHTYDDLEFKFPWDDTLMPLAPNFTALQNAVHNCVRAGCDTIWIIVNDNTLPVVKRVIGNAWKDYDSSIGHNDKNYRLIPIYYAPITVWDRNERDSHGWAALHGCYISRKVAGKISDWVKPKKFFISWPFGVYPLPKETRTEIKTNRASILLTYKNESVKDGRYLGFTINWDEVHRLRRRVWHNSTLRVDWFGNKLPKEEQNSARFFQLEDIFDDLNTKKYKTLEVEDYYEIDTWEGYVNCIANAGFIERPADDVLKYREFRGLANDED